MDNLHNRLNFNQPILVLKLTVYTNCENTARKLTVTVNFQHKLSHRNNKSKGGRGWKVEVSILTIINQ